MSRESAEKSGGLLAGTRVIDFGVLLSTLFALLVIAAR
jgi:hypothetical protein